MNPRNININEFDFVLPKERIALFPAKERDLSKLLVFNNGKISTDIFRNITAHIDENYVLVKNQTKVIPARIWFKKPSGAIIEIFCLSPVGKSHQDAMVEQGLCEWNCLIGGNKKWKEDELLTLSDEENQFKLTANRISKNSDSFIIRFEWSPANLTFSQVLEKAGSIPLPPYFERAPVEEDKERYQTVFAQNNGSVAAPTAGLHFTEKLLHDLQNRGVNQLNVTLHVGAGTFRPVSSETMEGHDMHSEEFSVSREVIEYLLHHPVKKIIPVGTTSMRTLESLFWVGVILERANGVIADLHVPQWIPYDGGEVCSREKSLKNILHYLEKNNLNALDAHSSIIIAPGYEFKICSGLITNFHMPKSTLLLLVSALIGDKWKEIYEYALKNDYRFLSYGDSSLLLP